jgi:hypothetical protein
MYANECNGFRRRQGKFMAASPVQRMTDYVRQRSFVRKRPIAPDFLQYTPSKPTPSHAGCAIEQRLTPDFAFVKDGRTTAEEDAADQVEADALASQGMHLFADRRHPHSQAKVIKLSPSHNVYVLFVLGFHGFGF